MEAAETKFWGSPELMEQLLFRLDLPATVALASSHPLTVLLLQGDMQWQSLILRANLKESKCQRIIRDMQKKIFYLSKLLKLMQATVMKPLLLHMLDYICITFPPVEDHNRHNVITLKDNREVNHEVSPTGYLLLALTEVTMGLEAQRHFLTEVKLESSAKYCFDAWFGLTRALTSLTKGRGKKVSWAEFETLPPTIDNLSFLQKCRGWKIWNVDVCGLSHSAWIALAKALAKGGHIESVIIKREEIVRARTDHLTALWAVQRATGS